VVDVVAAVTVDAVVAVTVVDVVAAVTVVDAVALTEVAVVVALIAAVTVAGAADVVVVVQAAGALPLAEVPPSVAEVPLLSLVPSFQLRMSNPSPSNVQDMGPPAGWSRSTPTISRPSSSRALSTITTWSFYLTSHFQRNAILRSSTGYKLRWNLSFSRDPERMMDARIYSWRMNLTSIRGLASSWSLWVPRHHRVKLREAVAAL
jgi:hypothetical protein